MTTTQETTAPDDLAFELDWITSRLKIRDKGGDLVDLIPNPDQVRFLNAVYSQWAAGVPVRIIILKYRQGGFSTITEALMFEQCQHQAMRQGLVAAHDDDSSLKLFEMTRLFQEELPDPERLPLERTNRKELKWHAPHRSHLMVATAGKLRLGRSMTLSMLHGSEVAFWTNAKQTLLSVLQAVPDRPGTLVVLESTANGVGGEFWERWEAAVARLRKDPNDLNGYIPLFFSWLDYDEYSMAIPAGYQWGGLDEDEEDLIRRGATPEQLYWRRRTIADKCGGDVAQFKQEYPSTPQEAFQASGRPVFPAKVIDHHKRLIERPKTAVLELDKKSESGVQIRFGDYSGVRDHWRVFRTPLENHDYTIACDIAEGELADQDDPKSEPDESVIQVLDRVDLELVAEYVSRADPDLVAEQMILAGWYYNNAWISPEANSAGMAAVVHIKRRRYARTFRRDQNDDKVDVEKAGQVAWKTTQTNRDAMIDDYLAWCRPDPDIENPWWHKLQVHSELLIAQEESFARDKTGKRQHRRGCHDDYLFAAFIALQLHLRCPRTRTLGRAMPSGRVTRRLAEFDAVDPGVPGDGVLDE